jgi:hypothetical protein
MEFLLQIVCCVTKTEKLMEKSFDANESDIILQYLSLFPEGASLRELVLALPKPLPVYTLRRRLMDLVKIGKVVIKGQSRASKYHVVSQKAKPSRHEGIPLSPESMDIEEKVTQPLHKRKAVQYNRELLGSYIPNSTQYLSQSTIQYLFQLGKTDGDRLAGTYARKIYNRLLIDLSWNSSRLEGNTYSLLETERLFQFKEIAEGKDITEAQMILNHKAAIEFLVETKDAIRINRFTILNLHALLSNNLLGNPESCGSLRKIPVGIGESVYQPTPIPQIVEECFMEILAKASLIHDPFEQAFFLMVHLPYLQPFEDVNKRVSRLSANIPLINNNLCPLSFVEVPTQKYINGLLGVYELNRIELLRDVFVWSYERSCQIYSTTRKTVGEPDPFRLRYHQQITEAVVSVVKGCLNKKMAIVAIRTKAVASIPLDDRNRFIETVEVELRGLHEGNIARYQLRQSEFEMWRATWV